MALKLQSFIYVKSSSLLAWEIIVCISGSFTLFLFCDPSFHPKLYLSAIIPVQTFLLTFFPGLPKGFCGFALFSCPLKAITLKQSFFQLNRCKHCVKAPRNVPWQHLVLHFKVYF